MSTTAEGIKIQTDKSVVYVQIFSLGLLLFFACAMTTLFFAIFGFGTSLGLFIVIATWVICIIVWFLCAFLASRRYESTEYILSKDALVLTQGSFLGSNTEMYRYDSILSVRIHEGMAAKTFGYSNLIVTIPKLGKDIILKGVKDPIKQAELIKQHINELQPTKIA